MKRFATVAMLMLVLWITGCVSLSGAANDGPSDPDQAAPGSEARLYAAVIREIYTVDHSFQEAPRWPRVYIERTTNDNVAFDGPVSEPKSLPLEIQTATKTALADLPAELIWIDNLVDAPVDPETGRVQQGDGIIITLGNIHHQEGGSALVSFWMMCGNLCGIGKTYVVEDVKGTWQVTGSVGPQVVS